MTLNTEVITMLADRIEQCREVPFDEYTSDMDRAFTMCRSSYECGAPACIMGHVAAMDQETLGFVAAESTYDVSRALGITPEQSHELCVPGHGHANYLRHQEEPGWITKAHAVAVLRHLANTGRVEWEIGVNA